MFVSIIIGWLLKDWMLTTKVSGTLGLICFAIAGILNRAFVSGDRNRANYSIEEKKERDNRLKISSYMFIIGVPNIIIAILIMNITK